MVFRLTGLETGGRYSGRRYWLAEVSIVLLSLLLHIEDHEGVKRMMITKAIASWLVVTGASRCRDHCQLTRIAEQTSGKRRRRPLTTSSTRLLTQPSKRVTITQTNKKVDVERETHLPATLRQRRMDIHWHSIAWRRSEMANDCRLLPREKTRLWSGYFMTHLVCRRTAVSETVEVKLAKIV